MAYRSQSVGLLCCLLFSNVTKLSSAAEDNNCRLAAFTVEILVETLDMFRVSCVNKPTVTKVTRGISGHGVFPHT